MITAYDLMDPAEVAEAFGVTLSSLQVALSASGEHVYPALRNRLPDPLRYVGKTRVWLRSEVEAALAVTP